MCIRITRIYYQSVTLRKKGDPKRCVIKINVRRLFISRRATIPVPTDDTGGESSFLARPAARTESVKETLCRHLVWLLFELKT